MSAAEARARYAERLASALRAPDPALHAAFAAVPREDFLGPPPWTLLATGPLPLVTHEPDDLYHDVLVVLDADKNINNGSPSLHAMMLHRLDVRPGGRVLHVGAGTGYYTAILAELVGPQGQVTAVEFDAALAAAARKNLQPWPQATVVHGDGAAYPTEPVDRIYVNFGLADPADAWLDNLAPGGVLILPLTAPASLHGNPRNGRGAMLVVTRTPEGFAAALELQVGFVFAEGPTAGDAALHAALRLAFDHGGESRVRSLHRGPLPPERCWIGTDRWSLGYDPPGV